MILQEEYNLNLESQLSKKYVKVSQYDTGRRLLITLLKNDCSMFKIPSEASASINGLKPDGKGFRYDCSIENNKVVVDMKEQMTVLAGYVKCEILLSKGGERIATANFMLSVEESPLSENTPISSTDIPLLQKAIEASEIVLSVEKTVKGYSESASKSSQSAQKSAESASNASASSAESASNSSQSAQASAESANNASQSATNAQESAESASTSATTASTKATEASTSATKAKESETNAKLSETNASNSAKEAKASAESVATVTSDVEKLKEDLPNKITKFYASNQGETHITDSDNGRIQDMMVYGKSSQDGTPSIENPVEIKSVVNPTIKVCGKNLLPPNLRYNDKVKMTIKKGVKLTIICKNGLVSNGGNLKFENANGEPVWFGFDEGNTKQQIDLYEDVFACNYLIDKRTSENYALYIGDGNAYEPYKEQSTQLPITLNAIPVSSGGNVTIDGQQYIADYVDVERGKVVRKVDSSKLDNTQSIIDKNEWLLAEQQETDLTAEQIQALKELATYYPVTNINVYSEKLDGSTVFNYPISMADGWNYVKKQLNDNRDYIYDMDLQSAEAYVNSEYAVTLTELEV